MKRLTIGLISLAVAAGACSSEKVAEKPADVPTKAAEAAPSAPETNLCQGFGPQTPRDISFKGGTNTADFPMANDVTKLNLCNIHTHTNAEHKGPGFSVFVNDSDYGGYACNNSDKLTEAELTDPADGNGAYKKVKPGDTIEVHWVHSSCDVKPGPTLGACLTDTCTDPLLRVETQVFLVVNNPEKAHDFTKLAQPRRINGKYQAPRVPKGTGEPVVFRGSTTGPSYTQETCSPFKVTWSVRPRCTKVDIGSLHKWAEDGNVFNETKSHGVRQLVTAPELVSPIQ